MDANRAQQISRSPDMVDVRHNGEPIYIQSVDARTESARVFPLANRQQERAVPVSELTEH